MGRDKIAALAVIVGGTLHRCRLHLVSEKSLTGG
jgi:hypothetical protein